jgi:hypothetical protein
MNKDLIKVIDNLKVSSVMHLTNLKDLMLHEEKDEIIEHLETLIAHAGEFRTVAEILDECCSDVLGISVEKLKQKIRTRPIADARSYYIALYYFATDHTWQYIGSLFNLDHASAISNAKKFIELYTNDMSYRTIAQECFDKFEKYGYNCSELKQQLNGKQLPVFMFKNLISRREVEQDGTTDAPTNKIERMSFHCAIS